MRKRITFELDDDIIQKLRKIQADKIAKETRNVSFSEVCNEFLAKSLK